MNLLSDLLCDEIRALQHTISSGNKSRFAIKYEIVDTTLRMISVNSLKLLKRNPFSVSKHSWLDYALKQHDEILKSLPVYIKSNTNGFNILNYEIISLHALVNAEHFNWILKLLRKSHMSEAGSRAQFYGLVSNPS